MCEKKICLVIPSLQAGGMERVMSELIKYLVDKKNLEIHLVLYGITREVFYPVPAAVMIHTPGFHFDNRYRLWFTLKTMVFVRSTIRKISPGSVLSFGEYWNNFVLLATMGLGVKIFVSDRSQPDKRLGKFHDFLRAKLYPLASGVIVQTRKAAEYYNLLYKAKQQFIIGNPVRSILCTPKKRGKQILMVARLIKSKHQDQLINIFSKLKAEDWQLVIVGDDHLKQQNREKLKALAHTLGVGDRVLFEGKQANVEAYYCSASIFAFTSSSEGFPNVIGEAQSAGLPVVAYDCMAGPSDLIIDGVNGFLIPLFDQSLFAEKLQLLIDNSLLRETMGRAGQETVTQFKADMICQHFLDVLS